MFSIEAPDLKIEDGCKQDPDSIGNEQIGRCVTHNFKPFYGENKDHKKGDYIQ